MGCWPNTGGLWPDALLAAVFRQTGPERGDVRVVPRIGCDTSMGKGEDWCSWHGRWGDTSHLHGSSNTMNAVRIAQALRDACAELAGLVNALVDRKATPFDPHHVQIAIDDDGTGGAVAALLSSEGYSIQAVGAATRAVREGRYPNKRSELWFETADRAKLGCVNLGRLPGSIQRRLRQQLTACRWDMDAAGRRVIEPKADLKERIGRSPDDADAFNLAYYEGLTWGTGEAVQSEDAPRERVRPAEAMRRGGGGSRLFGRG